MSLGENTKLGSPGCPAIDAISFQFVKRGTGAAIGFGDLLGIF